MQNIQFNREMIDFQFEILNLKAVLFTLSEIDVHSFQTQMYRFRYSEAFRSLRVVKLHRIFSSIIFNILLVSNKNKNIRNKKLLIYSKRCV